jgi:PPOX class probable FMN-dependent enzyme
MCASHRARRSSSLVAVPFDHAITDVSALRSEYHEPGEGVLRKAIDHIDDGARSFIARSPFVVVATFGPGGADASPRGGPPGFVRVLDEHRLALGDLAGNNRLDTYANVVERPDLALIFLVPEVGETLRVNGRGTLTRDPDVRAATAIDGRVPRVALGIDVHECFIHCAKAFRRSGLWDPGSWPRAGAAPSAAAILKEHIGIDAPAEVIAADLEEAYAVTMWWTGGREGETT